MRGLEFRYAGRDGRPIRSSEVDVERYFALTDSDVAAVKSVFGTIAVTALRSICSLCGHVVTLSIMSAPVLGLSAVNGSMMQNPETGRHKVMVNHGGCLPDHANAAHGPMEHPGGQGHPNAVAQNHPMPGAVPVHAAVQSKPAGKPVVKDPKKS